VRKALKKQVFKKTLCLKLGNGEYIFIIIEEEIRTRKGKTWEILSGARTWKKFSTLIAGESTAGYTTEPF
jgi:hypothetical protein